MKSKSRIAAYAIALMAAVTMTGVTTKNVHAQEEVNVLQIGTDAEDSVETGILVEHTTEVPKTGAASATETEIQMGEQVVNGRTVAYYNLNVNGGKWDGNNYVLNGVVVTDAFFCDGTYTYYYNLMENR